MTEKKTVSKKKADKKKSPKRVSTGRVSAKNAPRGKTAKKKISKEGKLAVVKIGGGQRLLREGDLLKVPRMKEKEKGKFVSKEVLLISSSKGVKVGTPFVKGAEVTFTVLSHGKDKKVEIRKFRAKSRYRRKTGHRQPISELRVERITA